MKETRDAIVSIMERVTLADLAERSRRMEQEPLQSSDFVI
jgi:DNA-binding IscR family transcriptional regulator